MRYWLKLLWFWSALLLPDGNIVDSTKDAIYHLHTCVAACPFNNAGPPLQSLQPLDRKSLQVIKVVKTVVQLRFFDTPTSEEFSLLPLVFRVCMVKLR